MNGNTDYKQQAEIEAAISKERATLRRQRDDLVLACIAAARMADNLRIAVSDSESDSDDATKAITAQISRTLREAVLAVPCGVPLSFWTDPYAPTPAAVEQARIDFERCHAAWMETVQESPASEEARRHKDEALIRWRSMRAAAGLDAPQ
jgi:hypothetical protein